MTPLDTELKAFVMFRLENNLVGVKVQGALDAMPWIVVSHPPLVATPNWCEDKYVVKVL
jgi:hypothetical protein